MDANTCPATVDWFSADSLRPYYEAARFSSYGTIWWMDRAGRYGDMQPAKPDVLSVWRSIESPPEAPPARHAGAPKKTARA